MLPLPALPLPRIFKAFEPENAKSYAMIFGPLLVVQWLLPWGGGLMSWNMMGTTLWALLAGIGLSVLAFAPLAGVKKGHIFAAVAGSGVIGIVWAGAGAEGGFFFLNIAGILGLSLTVSALLLRSRNGEKALYTNLLWAGVGLLAAGLLIPSHGTLPLLNIFKVLGAEGMNIVARIFFMLLSLGFIFLLVLVVMNVLLKGSAADKDQIDRSAHVLALYPFVALFLFGFLTFFGFFGIALHTLIILGTFSFLAVYGIVNVLEHIGRGEGIATLINAD